MSDQPSVTITAHDHGKYKPGDILLFTDANGKQTTLLVKSVADYKPGGFTTWLGWKLIVFWAQAVRMIRTVGKWLAPMRD